MDIEAGNGSEVLPRVATLAPGEPGAAGPLQSIPRDRPDRRPAATAGTTPASPEGPGAQANDDHAVSRDHRAWSEARPTALAYLRHAQRRSGRRPLALAREFIRLRRGCGRLTLPEYVQYGIYDTTRHGPAEQARFISNTLHWPITRACCDMTWQATTEDKWLCSRILAGSAVRTPATLAVIDRTDRLYPETEKISSVEQLRSFMTSPGALPLFAKENRGICSFGAFLVLEADRDAMHLKGHGWLGYDTCMDRFVGDTPYLLQKLESNHPFFDRYTDNLATVRVCVLMSGSGIRIPFAVLKLPSRDNVADSFWRPGNLACALNVRDGRILTARSKDPFGTTDHVLHPESGAPLVGESVPMWDRVLELAEACAPIFAPVRYQSMDIAIAPDGPVLIEVNTGGGFDLPQLASGEGFLTDEVREFFRACGCRNL